MPQNKVLYKLLTKGRYNFSFYLSDFFRIFIILCTGTLQDTYGKIRMYGGNDEIISIGENHTRDISVYFVFKGQITQPPAVTVRKIELKTCVSLIYCGLSLDGNEAPLLALGGSTGYSIKMSCKNLLKSYKFSENMNLHFCSLAKIYRSLSTGYYICEYYSYRFIFSNFPFSYFKGFYVGIKKHPYFILAYWALFLAV